MIRGNFLTFFLLFFTLALQTRLYTLIGKMIAVCVVHGGVGPHFFSERLFQQICGIPTSPALMDEVGDHILREQLIKVTGCLRIEIKVNQLILVLPPVTVPLLS